MTHTFDYEVSLYYWLLWPTVRHSEFEPDKAHITLAKTEIIYPKNVRAQVVMDFT